MADDERPDDDRLDEVGDQIDHARDTAEDADILEDPDEPRFADSGDVRPGDDDQQVAP